MPDMLTTTIPASPLKSTITKSFAPNTIAARLAQAERSLNIQFSRIAQLQAQVDVLFARARGGHRGDRG